jgi:hypothetical protein
MATMQFLRTLLLGPMARLRRSWGGGGGDDSDFRLVTSPAAPTDPDAAVHVVVTLNEINDMHGTGPLLKRVFQGRRGIFSIRSRDDWGTQEFGDWHMKISPAGDARPQAVRRVRRGLGDRQIKSVTCVPFLAAEIVTALAITQTYGCRLCGYIMDDQNVAANGIPDSLMREFLETCSLRLATHPELGNAYEQKYGLPFHCLPAVVPASLVAEHPQPLLEEFRPKRAALLGSFWDQSWFDRLCAALEPSGFQIDWYGQNWSPWFSFPSETLARAGISSFGLVPEDRLAAELRGYPFVIVPSGAFDGYEENTGVASLSLPGRILFAVATSHTPILMVGSERSCGAAFVERFGIGMTVPYDAAKLAHAMERMYDPRLQATMRANAAKIARSLSDEGVADWLKESIEQGRPADRRFENLFATPSSATSESSWR